jgi:S-adenosylmethionine hydrolase
VGTERRPVAVRANRSWFVGPDNGIFYPEWESRIPAPDDAIIDLDDPGFWLDDVSDTFHGRDIFAPVAAHMAAGVAVQDMGTATRHLVQLSIPRPEPLDDGTTRLQVLHVDHFGNLVTNMRFEELSHREALVTFSIGDATAIGVRTNFTPNEDLIAVAGSSGYVELAAPGGSAADNLAVELGATVIMRSVFPRNAGKPTGDFPKSPARRPKTAAPFTT